MPPHPMAAASDITHGVKYHVIRTTPDTSNRTRVLPSFLLDEAEAFSSRVPAFCLEGKCHPHIRVCVSRLSVIPYAVIDADYISYGVTWHMQRTTSDTSNRTSNPA